MGPSRHPVREVSGNATTRAARTAAGLCAVCLTSKARRNHPTCAPCAAASLAGDRARYARRREAGLCVRCEAPGRAMTDGTTAHLCHKCAVARRKRRTK